ncbi:MAG: thioredoxin family protein [Beijerinckiaceae bacterium]|nr:thioredoxin family protein [Beijerinckiaceae bacterium]
MSINRRSFIAAAVALGAAALFSPASAQEAWPFEMKAFEKAKAEGKSIFIDVTAPWCPTCKRQEPIIKGLLKKSEFKDLEVFSLDFDNQKNELKALRVTRQSTLITFKGAKETGRAVGITDPKAIEDLMRLAL